MSPGQQGQIRRSQVITTYGPGSIIDLPRHSAIVGGLDTWPNPSALEEIDEPRLSAKLQVMTGVPNPGLYAPPAEPDVPWANNVGIRAWRFPEWFLVQERSTGALGGEGRKRSRRLVHRKRLESNGRFENSPVVPIRFVRACPRGHIDDIRWYGFIHDPADTCRRQIWLDERGTGDLGDLMVRCECGKSRRMSEASAIDACALGRCSGARPWLGVNAGEDCDLPARLLIRTASNAYFAQLLSVLSLPDRSSAVETVVSELWDDLQIVESGVELGFVKKKPRVAERMALYDDAEVLMAIDSKRQGATNERPVKVVELDAILSAPEGYGDDVPVDHNFHARRLPEQAWQHSGTYPGIEHVIQLHRLREVLALSGFTRFEAEVPNIDGEYDTDVKRASLALEPRWFPAVENRGEGLFISLRADAVKVWQRRHDVKERIESLVEGHNRWSENRKAARTFPGGPYILLHTLSHLLIQSLSMRCGYPASSIRERIYVDLHAERFGVLLYTASPDAEGTLGGLVQQARHLEAHVGAALSLGAFCSNDPICAQHYPHESLEERWLHGAACHGCTLVAETSCEMRNDYLDRALVVPVLGSEHSAFFPMPL